MEVIAHQAISAVADVIEKTEKALGEHENASRRLDSEANALIRPVGRNLNRVYDRLESVGEDEEVLNRLEDIVVGGEDASFLNALDRDISAVCTYLQTVTSPLRENEVDGYARALERYAEVLKVVSGRNQKCVLCLFDHLSALMRFQGMFCGVSK